MCGFLKLNPLSHHKAQLLLSKSNLYRILISCKAVFARFFTRSSSGPAAEAFTLRSMDDGIDPSHHMLEQKNQAIAGQGVIGDG
jgi:hypothetical protein